MEWYKKLNIHGKINVKANFKLLCGISFEDLGHLFSFQERINIFYNKLKIEGFDV